MTNNKLEQAGNSVKKEIDRLVRDYTSVGVPKPKSLVRRELMDLCQIFLDEILPGEKDTWIPQSEIENAVCENHKGHNSCLSTIKQHAIKCQYPYAGDNVDGSCNCDSYHTFDELYNHRIELFITLCRLIPPARLVSSSSSVEKDYWMTSLIWRSKFHSNGTSLDGWFILGIGKEKGEQITYHIPLSRWDDTNFAQTLERAYTWDGHTSDDVLERLKRL